MVVEVVNVHQEKTQDQGICSTNIRTKKHKFIKQNSLNIPPKKTLYANYIPNQNQKKKHTHTLTPQTQRKQIMTQI